MRTTVLVAEDFDPFRKFICTMLQRDADLRIICEVSDGKQAVEKAVELQPALILLDLQLPSMNGIEAARRIKALCRQSKVIFVSLELSPEIVREALGTGAYGYVAKVDLAEELLTAVRAVLRGERFVGKRFDNYDVLPAITPKDRPQTA